MSLSTTATELRVATDGTSQVLSYPYKIFADTDITVDKIDDTTFVVTSLVINTDYTISATNNDFEDGATVTMIATHASGSTFVVNRNLTEIQSTTITESPALDIVHDKLVMLIQRHTEELKRCVQIPIQEVGLSELPVQLSRVDKALIFDSNGDLTVGDTAAAASQTAIQVQIDGTLSDPGDVSYDTTLQVLEVKGLGTTLQVGQELHVAVINKTGGTLNDGDVVYVSGYDATSDRLMVTKAQADLITTAKVLGVCTTTMADDAEGKLAVFGRVNNLDTSSFTEGATLFLSDTVAGAFTETKPVAIPRQIGFVGKVDASVGFIQVDIRELPDSIRGILSDTTDQTFTANVSAAITFDTQNVLEGLTHSTSVDSDEITFDNEGVYLITCEPQYTRTTGGGTDILNMYVQKDTGSGFVNVANSNIKVAISTANLEEVTTLTQTLKFEAGDKLRIMIQVEDSDLKLDAFVGFGSDPNDVPATPSCILNIHRIGD